MKYEQGQLVRYVGPNPHKTPNIYGWIGKLETYTPCNGNPAWKVFPPIPGGNIKDVEKKVIYNADWVLESSLQPIENPGEDAVDQMVLRVGKPKTEDKILTV